jgi:hypothetical protein
MLVWLHSPVAASHESVVHPLASSHEFNAPPTQAPDLHASATVQALPSLQLALLSTVLHPLVGLQLLSVQAFPSSQEVTAPGKHSPALQASPTVQLSLSLHGATLAT